jgi:hypothetical protein
MKKKELKIKIRLAFKDVKLEDGIGLWEGQGVDEYANEKRMLELREKDERNNWDAIPYKDLQYCESSLSFFDAKGMRFCLPKYLIFDLLNDKFYEKEGLGPPDLVFTLGHKLDEEYQKVRFSLFDNQQIQCVIAYLKYKISEGYDAFELNNTIRKWEQKLK